MSVRFETLIVDADDTLWENNIHFEDATERFLDLVESRNGRDREDVRALLEEIERRNIPVHGYGSGGFARSLMDTLEAVTGKPATAADRELIASLGERVRRMPIEFLPGVKSTLEVLHKEHRLVLFTKGDLDEQRDKVHRSGVATYFHEVEVTPDKKPEDYVRLVERHRIDAASSWMVGNSPRSDINPALEVGLGAVFIPHPRTWNLEHEEVAERPGGRLKILKRFSQLIEHFVPRGGKGPGTSG